MVCFDDGAAFQTDSDTCAATSSLLNTERLSRARPHPETTVDSALPGCWRCIFPLARLKLTKACANLIRFFFTRLPFRPLPSFTFLAHDSSKFLSIICQQHISDRHVYITAGPGIVTRRMTSPDTQNWVCACAVTRGCVTKLSCATRLGSKCCMLLPCGVCMCDCLVCLQFVHITKSCSAGATREVDLEKST